MKFLMTIHDWIRFKLKKYKILTCFSIFLLIFLVEKIPCSLSVEFDEATTAVTEAELKLESAFTAVSEAGTAGADIAGLIIKLEAGSLFLSESKLALRANDYDTANLLALESINTVENLIIEANQLKAIAEKALNDVRFFTFLGSSIGIFLLIIFGIIFWRVLKKRYFRQVLDMKPVTEE